MSADDFPPLARSRTVRYLPPRYIEPGRDRRSPRTSDMHEMCEAIERSRVLPVVNELSFEMYRLWILAEVVKGLGLKKIEVDSR